MNSRLLGIATQVMVMAIVVSVALLFLGIGALVLIHVCVVGRALRRGLRAMATGGRCSGGGRGLSLQELEMLPCYDFKDGDKGGGGDCAVCLESFQGGDRCRLLPVCKHSFHAQCVDSWLQKSAICPICRAAAGVGEGPGTPSGDERGQLGGGVGLELGQNPSVVVGFPMGSGPLPLQASTSG